MTASARCAWPGCRARISWRRTHCYRHWTGLPLDGREEVVRRAFDARSSDR